MAFCHTFSSWNLDSGCLPFFFTFTHPVLPILGVLPPATTASTATSTCDTPGRLHWRQENQFYGLGGFAFGRSICGKEGLTLLGLGGSIQS